MNIRKIIKEEIDDITDYTRGLTVNESTLYIIEFPSTKLFLEPDSRGEFGFIYKSELPRYIQRIGFITLDEVRDYLEFFEETMGYEDDEYEDPENDTELGPPKIAEYKISSLLNFNGYV